MPWRTPRQLHVAVATGHHVGAGGLPGEEDLRLGGRAVQGAQQPGLHGEELRVVTLRTHEEVGGSIRQRVHLWDGMDPRMVDAEHGWWFPERTADEAELFGVFESNANILCPNTPEFCSPEIGGWPHTALLCRLEKE